MISIKEIQTVFEWSYPTALNYATQHGELVKRDGGRDYWLVPVSAVEQTLNDKLQETIKMKARLEQIRSKSNGQ